MKRQYKKQFLLTFYLCLLIFAVSAQNSDELWSKRPDFEKNSVKKLDRKSIPKKFETYRLNINQFNGRLNDAPKRKGNFEKSNTVISFPNDKGKLEKYQIFEASIMEESLQKQYPNIRSYIGKGIDNPASIIRFSVTPFGLHAMVLGNAEGSIYIDPYTENDDSYIVYSSKNLPSIEPFECKFDEVNTSQKTSVTTISAKAENANDGKLRTFRLAVATTGEYSQFHLNRQGISSSATDAVKKAAVLSAIVTTMTRVNGIFERDVALRMILVANNTDIIFLDAVTDGFTNNDSNLLLEESQTVIDTKIGTANYDIGHTFSTGGGGLAQQNSPCTVSGKARGITGSTSPIGDAYDIDFVAHEMGHQYGANHTFNAEAGSCSGNRNTATAVEPGSGSTIMSYAGLCAPQNVQSLADPYFHLVSIREMWSNISTGSSTCAAISVTGNNVPTIENVPNYTIPKSTPFVLSANASDSDGDNLTYTWEQLDTETTTYPLVSTATKGPAFRSIPQTVSSKRYFPDQATVNVGNLSNTWEVLPSVARTMRFGVNVRDNNSVGGQTASKETVVTFAAGAGPFKVTSQSTAVTWAVGTSEKIIWDVANSNLAPVNCPFVNILLSVDGGLTFPTILVSNTPNDGSQEIVVPNTSTTTTARVKVESVGNIFYSVNTKNIMIQTSEFVMNFGSPSKNVCIPANAVYIFTYNTYNGFNEVTTFSAAGNPAGSTVSFNPATAISNNTNVQVTISGIGSVGNYVVSIKGTSASVTKTTGIYLGVYDVTIGAPTLVSPSNNEIDVLKPFYLNWNNDLNATNYDVQIAEDSGFASILESSNINISTYTPQNLQPETTYYWRVKSKNGCGEGVFSDIFKFTTENNICDVDSASDVPLSIPDDDTTGVSSIIFIANNKIIRDVNVTVNITHPWIGDLDLMLISPSGKSVLLVSSREDDGLNYTKTVFDDSASLSISSGAAPYTGTFRSQENLSKFINEESYGDWNLKIVDSGPEDIGTIDSWNIEICGVPLISNDDDKDGVLNISDLCTNTPLGSEVNATGCPIFSLPSNNFTIEVIGETCPDKNNGQIKITANETHNYFTVIDETKYYFTKNLTITDVAPGVHIFSITVIGGIYNQNIYKQNYSVQIESGTLAKVSSSVLAGKAIVEIEQGTSPFRVFINGQEQFETNEPLFSVDVKSGDVLEVKTAVSCEGIYSKTIGAFEAVSAYPNPTFGTFEITIPTTQTEVVIEMYSILSQLILVKTYPVIYGKVQLSLENKPMGLYIVKVLLEQPVSIKMIKQ